MAAEDITTSAAPTRPSPQADLAWPFAYEISALNAIADLYGSASDTSQAPTRPSPQADLAWPFAYEISALNAIAKLLEAG